MNKDNQTWYGKIPNHWSISKINTLYELRNEKVSDEDYQPLSVTMQGILPQLDNAAKTNAHDDRKLVKKGDFAINSRSDRRGSCGISDYDGSVSLINIIMKPREKMNPSYYNYLFHTIQFADEFYKWGHGIVDDLWTTTWQDMKHIDVPVPPLKEQETIAKYLKEYLEKIDGLKKNVEEEKEKLVLYKKSIITKYVTKGITESTTYKDSNIGYVGLIPESWKVEKVKYSFYNKKYIPGINADKYDRLALTLKGVVHRDKEDAEGLQPKDFETYQLLEKNELVFKLIDLQNVSTSRVGLSKFDGLVSPAYIILHSNGNIIPEYAEYFFLMMWHNEVFNALGDSGVRSSLNVSDLLNLPIIKPSIDEQRSIAKELDRITQKIDLLIEMKDNQLNKINDFKKSLIFEIVTGKKEINI